MQKFLLLLLGFSIHLIGFSQADELEEISNDFFKKYTSNGKVHYQRLYNDPSDLDQLVQLYGMDQFSGLEGDAEKAFLINAYNLFVIKFLIDEYPKRSPQEIAAFFTQKKFLLANEKVSLDEIEKKKLSPSKDPRLHFALICGANGCPPIANYAYRASNLDSLLDQQSRRALNSPQFIQENENAEVGLSEIFKWYAADFKKSTSLIGYINQYREKPIPAEAKTSYYNYDWTINSVDPNYGLSKDSSAEMGSTEDKSNLQLFTPSALFQWGEYEVNNFNSLYYQNSIRDASGEEQDLGNSQAFFNALIQITSGLPKIRRLNVGIDINITTARYGLQEETPGDFFKDETAIYRKTIVSSIGPRLKYVPFRKIPRLSIQSTFLFPIASDQEDPFFIFHDRYSWFTQVFFDQNIGDKFQLFTEADLLYRFNRNSTFNGNFFRVPLSAFLSYFPTSNSTIYVFTQYSPRYQNVELQDGSEFGLHSWFTQLGVGAKYQLTSKLGLELSYADFAWSKNDGAGYAMNFGIRYIHR